MYSDIDLHTHSHVSDGQLAPAALVRLAAEQGVGRLALTDHDTVDGCAEAGAAAAEAGIEFIPGVEISAAWANQEIHVVGVWVDTESEVLLEGLAAQQARRERRGERIAKRLTQQGIPGALEGARAEADGGALTRAHFARWLVAEGHVPDFPRAFRRYLGRGKPAGVASDWPELATVIEWIAGAGGMAVLAHPLKYRLTASKLRRLLADFADDGGHGVEVRSGADPNDRLRHMITLAERYELLASIGSDFHAPTRWRPGPGRLPTLPSGTATVWDARAGEGTAVSGGETRAG